MAGLDWAALGLLGDPNWGFVVNLATASSAAAPPPGLLGGAGRGLLPPLQAHRTPATCEPITSTSTLAPRHASGSLQQTDLFFHVRIRFVFGVVLPDLLIVDLGA